MQELLAISNNGVKVTFDPINSHAATHFEDSPQLKNLVENLISKLELLGQEIAQHYDMGKIIGTTDVVNVRSSDEIVFGVRKNREDDGLVPFVKNRKGVPSSLIAVHLLPQKDGNYILSSAWIGTFGEDDEPFPLTKEATVNSINFWNKHAFVYGSQEIIPGTETKICPW